MKQQEQSKSLFATPQLNVASLKPEIPSMARQGFLGRRASDPSSVLRSDRYPVPAFSDHRFRIGE